jgi:hypothetical protein
MQTLTKITAVVSVVVVLFVVLAVAMSHSSSSSLLKRPFLPELAPEKTTLLSQPDNEVFNGPNEPDEPTEVSTITSKATPVTSAQVNRSVTRNNFVFVDSDLYDSNTGTLPVTFDLRNVISLELYSISIPKGQYVISSLNNSFTVTTGGTDYTIGLSTGDYDAKELAAHVQAQIRAGTGDATFTCEYIALTTSYKFSSTAAEFQLVFTDADRLLQYNFGLPQQSNTSSNSGGTHTLDGSRIDLFNARYLQISCDEMRKHYTNTNVIATVDLSDELNYKRGYDSHFLREFPSPIERWRGITLKLQTKMPYVDLQPYQNRGLGFHLCLCLETLHKQQDVREINDIIM